MGPIAPRNAKNATIPAKVALTLLKAAVCLVTNKYSSENFHKADAFAKKDISKIMQAFALNALILAPLVKMPILA